MRSLALKLTLAFLFVGVIGAGLVAVFVGWQTESQFDQYIYDLYHDDLLTLAGQLSAYYHEYGSWDGISSSTILIREQFDPSNGQRGNPPGGYRRGNEWLPVTLVDADRVVVNNGHQYMAGDQLSRRETNEGLPVELNNETVGWIVVESFGRIEQSQSNSPESAFLANINRATIFGALAASAIALLLGVVLARSISRPVGEITAATRVIARGRLGHQVPVRTEDELGELAASFNQMSADLDRANQSRRQMTADIAHDLRTPMSVILGYTESLKDGRLQGSQETFDIVHQEARHLSHLIEDLRILSLADAGELPLIQRPIPPQALLERVALAHMSQAVEGGINLEVKEQTDLPHVDIDPERMTQVLGNLVSNALRYTLPGGTISLAANKINDQQLTLTVQDSGNGIPAEELPHIFERFYRGDKVRSRTGSSGLGLAIARSIVEAHKGTISAESQEESGTTFTITLPIHLSDA
jgi:signal transduction histidine kinase